MTNLLEIEGIGDTYAAKFEKLGITSQAMLLQAGGTPAKRDQLAEVIGVSPTLILSWINRADLARVKGIGGEYAELLENAGVDTVPALSRRNAENLHSKMREINAEKKLVRKLPSAEQVKGWIEQARHLPRAVHY